MSPNFVHYFEGRGLYSNIRLDSTIHLHKHADVVKSYDDLAVAISRGTATTLVMHHENLHNLLELPTEEWQRDDVQSFSGDRR